MYKYLRQNHALGSSYKLKTRVIKDIPTSLVIV